MKRTKSLFLIVFIGLLFGILGVSFSQLKSAGYAAEIGGRIMIYNGATYELTGGTISDGAVGSGAGGGIEIWNGTLNFSNATIKNCTATFGGGVDVDKDSTFNMKSGEITGCTAENMGGAVVCAGKFNMSGGKISGNTASYGGGIYLQSTGIFTMTGGTISGNTASTGAGIHIIGGTFNYGGGTISDEISTNTTININKRPSSTLKIYYRDITVGTQIAKVASGVTASTSDYNVTNLPSGMKLEVQNISGTNYIVVAAQGILVVAEGNGTVSGRSSVSIQFPPSQWAGASGSSYCLSYYYYEIKYSEDTGTYTLFVYKILVPFDGNKMSGRDGYIYDAYMIRKEAVEARGSGGAGFVGFFVDGKPLDNRLPRSERFLTEGTTIAAKFDSSAYYLTFNCGYSGSVEYGKVVGNGVTKLGTGVYRVAFAPGTKIKYLGGSYFVGDNEIQVYPKLGYTIRDVSYSGLSSSGPPDSDGYITATPTGNVVCTFTIQSGFFSFSKLQIGCIDRQELTRNETIMVYAFIYAGSTEGYGRRYRCDAPIVDAGYYDEYTTEEIYAAIQSMITLTGSISNTNWLNVGDMFAAYKDTKLSTTSSSSINNYLQWYWQCANFNLLGANSTPDWLVPIGNEVSSVRGTEYNNGGYYVFWPNGVSQTNAQLFGDRHDYNSVAIFVDSKPNENFKLLELLNYMIDQDSSRSASHAINYSSLSYSDLTSLENWGNVQGNPINCIICSLDVFAENSSKYESLIKALTSSSYNPQAKIEPFVSAVWRSMASSSYYNYAPGLEPFTTLCSQAFGDIVQSTGLFENAILFGYPVGGRPYDLPILKNYYTRIDELIEGLRDRWMPVVASYVAGERVDGTIKYVFNQYFNIKTYFDLRSPKIEFVELTGDISTDLDNAACSAYGFKVDNNDEGGLEEKPIPEIEKNLFFDNKRFYLSPIKRHIA